MRAKIIVAGPSTSVLHVTGICFRPNYLNHKQNHKAIRRNPYEKMLVRTKNVCSFIKLSFKIILFLGKIKIMAPKIQSIKVS